VGPDPDLDLQGRQGGAVPGVRRHRRLHRRHAFSDELRIAHQTGAEAAILHAVGGTADIEVDLCVAEIFGDLRGFGECGRLAAAELDRDRLLARERQLADARTMKQQALKEQKQATAIVVMCWIAAALLNSGHLRLLQQECLQAQGLLEQAGIQVAVGAYPAFDLSFLYYERNQLEKAEACLRAVMDHTQRWQDMQLLAWSYGVCMKVLLASGKLAQAEQMLQGAQSLMQGSDLLVYEPSVIAAQVALWLAQGNLSAAGAWAEHYLFNPDAPEYLRQHQVEQLQEASQMARQPHPWNYDDGTLHLDIRLPPHAVAAITVQAGPSPRGAQARHSLHVIRLRNAEANNQRRRGHCPNVVQEGGQIGRQVPARACHANQRDAVNPDRVQRPHGAYACGRTGRREQFASLVCRDATPYAVESDSPDHAGPGATDVSAGCRSTAGCGS